MANLSSKEITALEEQLSAERMLVAKYRGMASQCSNAVIKNKLDTIASRHQQHFDRILTFLN